MKRKVFLLLILEVISLTSCSIKASDSRVLDKEQAEEIETTDTSINNTIISIEQTEEIETTNNSISIKQTEEIETIDTSISIKQTEEMETTDTSINNTIISIEQTEEIETTNNSISIKQTEEIETTDTIISIEQTEEMETTDTLENLEQSENKEKNTTENEYKPNEWEAQLENTNINEIEIGGEKIEIKKEIIDINENIDNRHIEYPYLDSENAISQQINSQIYAFIETEGLWDCEYTVYEEITYKVIHCENHILSILFTGYRNVAGGYGDFDMGLNFNMENGELLSLKHFYDLQEIKQLLEEDIAQNKLLAVTRPFDSNDEQIQDYIKEYFEGSYLNESYIMDTNNFFTYKGNLYFITNDFPSMRQNIYIKWENSQPLLK